MCQTNVLLHPPNRWRIMSNRERLQIFVSPAINIPKWETEVVDWKLIYIYGSNTHTNTQSVAHMKVNKEIASKLPFILFLSLSIMHDQRFEPTSPHLAHCFNFGHKTHAIEFIPGGEQKKTIFQPHSAENILGSKCVKCA